jgi:L-threonylcarbamoyladenylate synthase
VKAVQTEVIKIDRSNIDPQVMARAGAILKEGGLVAFPTETVYGLGANGLDEEAAKKIYEAKGRPSDNPLIIHIADWESLGKIVQKIPPAAKQLADAYWPGPLTMIFEKSDLVPYGTTGGLDTVAVRMPSDAIALEMIRQGGGYIAAPSANTSGRPSPTKAEHVYEDMKGRIPLILDGGSVQIGLESTIVDLTTDMPTVLRPGYISVEMVQEVLGKAEIDRGLIANDSNIHPKAPGMKYRHYAPKADLKIIEGPMEQVISYINHRADPQVGIICTEETRSSYPVGNVKCIGSRKDELSIANHLFAILREFDEDGVRAIYSESFEAPGLGQAIMNRLLKAAGHQRIDVTKEQEDV